MQPVVLLSSYPSFHAIFLGAQLNVQLRLTLSEKQFLFGDRYGHSLLLLMQYLNSFFKSWTALTFFVDKFPNLGELIFVHLFLSAAWHWDWCQLLLLLLSVGCLGLCKIFVLSEFKQTKSVIRVVRTLIAAAAIFCLKVTIIIVMRRWNFNTACAIRMKWLCCSIQSLNKLFWIKTLCFWAAHSKVIFCA